MLMVQIIDDLLLYKILRTFSFLTQIPSLSEEEMRYSSIYTLRNFQLNIVCVRPVFQ